MEREYKAVKLSYSADANTATSGIVTGRKGVDLSEVNELCSDGWEVHSFSFDRTGCWEEAILERES